MEKAERMCVDVLQEVGRVHEVRRAWLRVACEEYAKVSGCRRTLAARGESVRGNLRVWLPRRMRKYFALVRLSVQVLLWVTRVLPHLCPLHVKAIRTDLHLLIEGSLER
ncbi:hypothetical protein E2C01_056662 [Portunus trituberculatus]|uniref:Uncharacterized protein n=1 Tax=Portunus trituberculatus TaxID=210409 RepID=A0A5B7GYC2_PORTR|nr:hypothetical protein [Portunus trituberculatus]